jgi:pilus assembly protein CpaE
MAVALQTRQAESQGQVRHLAYVADGETAQIARECFDGLGLAFSDVRKGTVKEARAHVLENGSPQLLVVDIQGHELPVTAVDELAEVCEPGVKVVVVGEQTDIGLFRDLIRIGVSDYIAQPVTRDHLQRAVQTALSGESPQRQRTGKVVAVTGARGGVGVSTLAANVGWWCAHKLMRRVALVDLDLHAGSLDVMLGVKSVRGLREALEAEQEPDGVFLERALAQAGERLYLMCAREPLDELTQPSPGGLDRLVTALCQRFHFVIIDVPRQPGPLAARALARADIRLVVADPSLPAVREQARLAKLLDQAGGEGRRTLRVLNRRAPEAKGQVPRGEAEHKLEQAFDHEVPFDREAIAAETAGEALAAKGGSSAAVLRRLAEDVSGKGRPRARVGLFGRVLKRGRRP